MAKVSTLEVLQQIDGIISSLTGAVSIGLTVATGSIALYKKIKAHFESKDPAKMWTKDEINSEANTAIAELTERHKRIQQGKEETEEPILDNVSANELDEDE